MFDVDEHIRQWRRDLNNAEVCHSSDLEELETHLRDQMEGLGGKGLSTEEAFIVASRRLGSRTNLACEYAKVNPHALFFKRLLWVCIGVLACILIPRITATFTQGIALAALKMGMTQSGLNILIPAIQTVTLAIGVLSIVYFIRLLTDNATSLTWHSPFKKRLSLFILLALIDIGILLMPSVLAVVTGRYFGAQDFGKIALAKMYVNALSPMIISLVMIGLAVRLAPLKHKIETP